MHKNVVEMLLRAEENKRRSEAKKRDDAIAALYEGGSDFQGKLWNENSIDDIAAKSNNGNGVKWTTDSEAELCADVEWGLDPDTIAAPDKALRLLEAQEIALKVIGRRWGEEGIQLFSWWLDGTVAEVSQEQKLPPVTTLETIKEMVEACRKEAGTWPANLFPFADEEAELRKHAKTLKVKAAVARVISGESIPSDPENRVYLTEEEKEMALDPLYERLQEKYGFKPFPARSTIWRAKKSGWFMKPGWKTRVVPAQKIFLSAEEMKMTGKELYKRIGVHYQSASKAKKRGYFYMTRENKVKVRAAFSARGVSIPTNAQMGNEGEQHE